MHEAVLPALEQAIANLEREEAAGNYYEIRAGDVSSFRPSTVTPQALPLLPRRGRRHRHQHLDQPLQRRQRAGHRPARVVREGLDRRRVVLGRRLADHQGPDALLLAGPPVHRGLPAGGPRRPRAPAAALPPLRHLRHRARPGARRRAAVPGRRRPRRRPGCDPGPPLDGGGQPGSGDRPGHLRLRGRLHPAASPRRSRRAAALLMADGDGDARPDLWEIDASGDEVAVTIHTHASGFAAAAAAPPDGGGRRARCRLPGRRLRPRRQQRPVRAATGRRCPGGLGRARASTRLLVGIDVSREDGGGLALRPRRPRPRRGARPVRPQPRRPGSPAWSWPGPAGYAGEAGGGHDRRRRHTRGPSPWATSTATAGPTSTSWTPTAASRCTWAGERGEASDEDLIYWFVEGDDQPTTRQEACPVVP